ncbi:IS200/IS605 family element transposase accessory protein TnpB [Bacillus sp. FJAT-27245]|uniref:IS200/IS605 family element transposase accessory protein TnpB n=1 Tax=Bacillus sp. FJAT-27245 TaxID=1684144 RepID=UPI0006A78498|nr:IS200/IS605 family element transposase accessory protein TnpB [Bacillus sp. FJAT-27245]
MPRKRNEQAITFTGTIVSPPINGLMILDELMRKFQSAKRFSRERIFDGMDRKTAVAEAKALFLPNSRYMRDAFLEAEASISSQKELLPLYVEQYKTAIQKIEKKIEKIRNSKKKNKEDLILYQQSRIKKLIKKMNYYLYHIQNGSVPKVVDGTKKRLIQLNKHKITKQEWIDSRTNALYSRGEASKGGNENIKLDFLQDCSLEMNVLNPLSSKKNDRLFFEVKFSEKHLFTILTHLASGQAYSVRILRENGKYYVHVTFNQPLSSTYDFSKGCAGIDINPDNIAVTIVHPNGNFRASKVFWMEDINHVHSNRRDWIIGNTVASAIGWLKLLGIETIAIEDLYFKNDLSKNAKFNRMSSNFVYRKIITTLISKCIKAGVSLAQVPGYYSSLIGRVKYQKTYGLSIHQSAALVLARRAMGFNEKIPKQMMSVLFAKEAKEGPQPSDLFKHWKKVQAWFSAVKDKAYKNNEQYNHWFINDFIRYASINE